MSPSVIASCFEEAFIMQQSFVRLSTLSGALLLLVGAPACVDASRVDVLETSVARMAAEAAQRDQVRDQQVGWLRWGQIVLAGEVYGHSSDRDGLARRLAALEAENAALTARLEHAEQHREAPRIAFVDAPARVLDETVPYDLGFVARRPDKRLGKRPEAPPPRAASAHARRLDENVPYEHDARSSDAKDLPRVLDETVPY